MTALDERSLQTKQAVLDNNDRWVEYLIGLHTEAVRVAYKLARGARLAQLQNQRVKRYDSRGIEPYSEAVGVFEALQTALPNVLADPWLRADALELRIEAEKDAYYQFRQEVADGITD